MVSGIFKIRGYPMQAKLKQTFVWRPARALPDDAVLHGAKLCEDGTVELTFLGEFEPEPVKADDSTTEIKAEV